MWQFCCCGPPRATRRHRVDRESSDTSGESLGRTVRLWFTYLFSLRHLRIDPFPKHFVLAVQNGNGFEDGEQPHQMAEKANIFHVAVQSDHEVVFDTIPEHSKRLSPGQVTHDVETVKIEPLGHVDWLSLFIFKLLK